MNPVRALLGAFLFGGLTALQFYFQAVGVDVIPSFVLKVLLYVLAIGVTVVVNAVEVLPQNPINSELITNSNSIHSLECIRGIPMCVRKELWPTQNLSLTKH